jgi:hypothetical protein
MFVLKIMFKLMTLFDYAVYEEVDADFENGVAAGVTKHEHADDDDDVGADAGAYADVDGCNDVHVDDVGVQCHGVEGLVPEQPIELHHPGSGE